MSHADHVAASRLFVVALAVTGRVIGWSALGTLCGLLGGLGNGLLLAPPVGPEEPPASGRYVDHLVTVILPAEILAGLVVGAIISVLADSPVARPVAFMRALIGAFVGLGLTAACIRVLDSCGVRRPGWELWFCFLMQAAGAAVVVGLGIF
jgi:hypothetical protein